MSNTGSAIQFKQVVSRVLGPMSLNVQSNEAGERAKGIDIVLPAFTWALEVRIFLPIPTDKLAPQATEGFRRVDQDIESNIFSPPNMRLSLRFHDEFFNKHQDLITDSANFKIMAYVVGFIDLQANDLMEKQMLEQQARQAEQLATSSQQG